MNELENDMIIEGTTTRLLNEEEIRIFGTYHVSIENNDVIRLTLVERSQEGNYIPQEGSTITVTEDGTNGSRKLSEYTFVTFVKPVLYPDPERERVSLPSKGDRLAKLFEDISPEDIMEYLKKRGN